VNWGGEIIMSWKNKAIGLGAGCAALMAAFTLVPSKASADEAPLTVTPAVYRVGDTGASGGTIQLVGHRGWYGRGGGWGWGGYRGYYRGYGYRGFYRPYYRPFYGANYGPGFGYGSAYPGYGYGYRGW
jgi:hypothetical protein